METPHVGQGTDNCLAVSSFFRIWNRMQQDVRKKLFNLEHNQFEFLGTNIRKLQYIPRENVLLASNDHPSVTTPTGNRDACQPPIHDPSSPPLFNDFQKIGFRCGNTKNKLLDLRRHWRVESTPRVSVAQGGSLALGPERTSA